jgi:DegV family protein with EDD domain
MVVKIVTDSTSDIAPDIASELGITVIPAQVEFGEEIYTDGINLTPVEFYEKLEKSAVLPKTSPPAPGTFGEAYNRLARDADAIISIYVSADLSTTFQSAKLGASDLPIPVSFIDSRSASMACGLLAILAAKLAISGASFEEIESEVNDCIPRTITYGLFDTLEYLVRGGRIGKAQAFIGTILSIKPILAIKDGQVLPIERVRTRTKAMNRLFELVKNPGALRELSIMDSTTPEDAEVLAERFSAIFPRDKIYMTKVGPVMGTYVGPRFLGVAVIWERPEGQIPAT